VRCGTFSKKAEHGAVCRTVFPSGTSRTAIIKYGARQKKTALLRSLKILAQISCGRGVREGLRRNRNSGKFYQNWSYADEISRLNRTNCVAGLFIDGLPSKTCEDLLGSIPSYRAGAALRRDRHTGKSSP
jgi:hypothetical protein